MNKEGRNRVVDAPAISPAVSSRFVAFDDSDDDGRSISLQQYKALLSIDDPRLKTIRLLIRRFQAVPWAPIEYETPSQLRTRSQREGTSEFVDTMRQAGLPESLANVRRLSAAAGKAPQAMSRRFPEFIVGANNDSFYRGLEDCKKSLKRSGTGAADPSQIDGDILARRLDEDGQFVRYEPLHDLRERSRHEGTAEFRDRLRAAGLSEDLADRPAMGPAVLVSVSRTGAFVAGEKFPFELGKPRIPLEIPRNYIFAKTAGGDYESLAEVWPTRRTADDFAAGVLWQVHGMETPEFWVETAPGRFASKQSYDRMRGDPTGARRLPENPRLLICRPDGDGPEIPFRVKQIAERRDPYEFRRIMGRAGMPDSLGSEPYEVPPVLVLTPDGDLRAGETFPQIPGGQRIPDDIESGRIFVQGVFADGEPTGTYSGISRDSPMPRLAHWIHPDALRQAGIEDRDASPKPAMRTPGPGRPAATEGTVIDLTKDDPPGAGPRGRGGRPMRGFSGAPTVKLDPDGDTIMHDAFPAPREPFERRLPAEHGSRTVIDLTGDLPDKSGETPTLVRGIKRGRETTAEPPGRGLDKRLRGNSREIT